MTPKENTLILREGKFGNKGRKIKKTTIKQQE